MKWKIYYFVKLLELKLQKKIKNQATKLLKPKSKFKLKLKNTNMKANSELLINEYKFLM